MTQKLRKLADEHAVCFWILCMLIYVVGYKVFRVTFLEKTPYMYDTAFLKLSLSLLAIIMMKGIYAGNFSFHFSTKQMGKGFLLFWPIIPVAILNIASDGIIARPIVLESFIMLFTYNMMTGLYEEVVMRGMLLGHMMRHWKEDDRRILKSVLSVSILFGVVHLGNLVYGDVIGTLFQVLHATAAGLLFAAVYLRTQNLWSCIIVHGLFDLSGHFSELFYAPGAEMIESEGVEAIIFLSVTFGFIIISTIVSLYMLRKAKKNEIISLWN